MGSLSLPLLLALVAAPMAPAAFSEWLQQADRLQLEQGRHALALSRLELAAATQQRLGDMLGLARTTDALARTLSAMHNPGEALRLLGASVELNAAKGATLGLKYNRRTLAHLAESFTPEEKDVYRAHVEALVDALEPDR